MPNLENKTLPGDPFLYQKLFEFVDLYTSRFRKLNKTNPQYGTNDNLGNGSWAIQQMASISVLPSQFETEEQRQWRESNTRFAIFKMHVLPELLKKDQNSTPIDQIPMIDLKMRFTEYDSQHPNELNNTIDTLFKKDDKDALDLIITATIYNLYTNHHTQLNEINSAFYAKLGNFLGNSNKPADNALQLAISKGLDIRNKPANRLQKDADEYLRQADPTLSPEQRQARIQQARNMAALVKAAYPDSYGKVVAASLTDSDKALLKEMLTQTVTAPAIPPATNQTSPILNKPQALANERSKRIQALGASQAIAEANTERMDAAITLILLQRMTTSPSFLAGVGQALPIDANEEAISKMFASSALECIGKLSPADQRAVGEIVVAVSDNVSSQIAVKSSTDKAIAELIDKNPENVALIKKQQTSADSTTLKLTPKPSVGLLLDEERQAKLDATQAPQQPTQNHSPTPKLGG